MAHWQEHLLPQYSGLVWSWTKHQASHEFVVGSHPCSKGFSPGSPVSASPPPSTKTKTSKLQLMLQTVGKEAPAIDVQLQIFTFYLVLYSHMLTRRYTPTNCARALLSLLNFLFELTLSSSISCCGSGSKNLQQQLVTINNIHCPSLKYNAYYNDWRQRPTEHNKDTGPQSLTNKLSE